MGGLSQISQLSLTNQILKKDLAVCASRNYSEKETYDYVEQKVQTYYEKQENSRRKKMGLGSVAPSIVFQDPADVSLIEFSA